MSAFFYAREPSSGYLYLDLSDVKYEQQVHAKLGIDKWQYAWQTIKVPHGTTHVTVRVVRDGDIKPNENSLVDEIALTPVAEFFAPQRRPTD